MVLEALETYYQNETSLRQCVSARDHLHIALGLEQSADFKPAQKIYEDLAAHSGRTIEGRLAAVRLPDLNELIAEKETYRRIHANAVRVLTDIGMNIAAHEELINILMEAEAIDLDNTEANLVPLKADYIQRCLDLVPRWFPGDPGRNAFGTGGTPPFFRVNGEDSLRPAARDEFKEIVRIAALWSGLISMFSIPVRSEKDMSDHECALTMERGFPGLKMTATCQMSDREAAHLSGRSDWLDGTSLMCNLAPMGNMIGPFIRSAGLGNNMLLLDMAIAGASGPNTPEALLTHIHAQILFMMVLVQTIRPGTICIHGGMPSVSDSGGDLSYSSPLQPLINAAMARLNLWVTGLPSRPVRGQHQRQGQCSGRGGRIRGQPEQDEGLFGPHGPARPGGDGQSHVFRSEQISGGLPPGKGFQKGGRVQAGRNRGPPPVSA